MPTFKFPVPALSSFGVHRDKGFESIRELALSTSSPALVHSTDATDLDITDSGTLGTYTWPMSYNLTQASVYFFKGTKPTQSEMDAMSENGSMFSERGSDILIDFMTDIGTEVDLDSANNRIKVTLSSSRTATAEDGGVASWWTFNYRYSDPSRTNTNDGRPFYMGDISGIGGGGEVQLADTTIVNGQDYILTAFSFYVPAHIDVV